METKPNSPITETDHRIDVYRTFDHSGALRIGIGLPDGCMVSLDAAELLEVIELFADDKWRDIEGTYYPSAEPIIPDRSMFTLRGK